MNTSYIDKVKLKFPETILDSHSFRGDQTILIIKESVLKLFKYLRDEPDLDFKFLMDLTAVDYLNRKQDRFEIVYHFYSLTHNSRLRIKAPVGEKDCSIDSVSSLWKNDACIYESFSE